MDLTENPKLDFACNESEKMSTQKISVSDHMNGFQYTTYKSDNFVIDLERFSHGDGGGNKQTNPNSRITLQRSFSRKGFQRGEKKIIAPNCTNSNSTSLSDGDSFVATSSPEGSSTPEKPTALAVGSTDHASNQQVHHQITIKTGNINAASSESRFSLRRDSFRRSSPPWLFAPKKILFFFATLSSMGTILLIYFTLSMNRMNRNDDALD